MIDSPVMTFAYIGICVSDLERSARFYTEALGFVFDHTAQADSEFKGNVEFDDLQMHRKIYEFDGCIIEFMHVDAPGFKGPQERRPMKKLGFRHFSVAVDDVNAVADRIIKFGGKAYPHTRVSAASKGEFAFCTDPDGVRIQLWQRPAV